MSTSQIDLTKHAATQLASLIVKVSQSEDELIRVIAEHLEIQTNLYQMLEFISENPSETNVIAIRRLLAKARGES